VLTRRSCAPEDAGKKIVPHLFAQAADLLYLPELRVLYGADVLAMVCPAWIADDEQTKHDGFIWSHSIPRASNMDKKILEHGPVGHVRLLAVQLNTEEA
jgi:hypothetical protein